MSFKRDLVTLCEGAGVGVHNVTIFTGSKSSPPLLPNGQASMSIIETGGTAPERTNTTRTSDGQIHVVTLPAYEHPSAILITRSTSPSAAEAMARAAYLAVGGFRNGFINSGWYREITPDQEPTDAGLADRGEVRITFNVTAIKRPS